MEVIFSTAHSGIDWVLLNLVGHESAHRAGCCATTSQSAWASCLRAPSACISDWPLAERNSAELAKRIGRPDTNRQRTGWSPIAATCPYPFPSPLWRLFQH
jgi:hypothetical protein